jgi:hypothetical protein
MTGKASAAFTLLAVGLLGYAGYRYATDRDPPPGDALVIHDPDRDLGSQAGQAEVPLRFRITNRSSRSIRVLNLVPG